MKEFYSSPDKKIVILAPTKEQFGETCLWESLTASSSRFVFKHRREVFSSLIVPPHFARTATPVRIDWRNLQYNTIESPFYLLIIFKILSRLTKGGNWGKGEIGKIKMKLFLMKRFSGS
jgi:hypothetical protein